MAKIKELPEQERPREKAIIYGIDVLSDAELLAILIGSGYRGKSAVDIGNDLLSEYHGLSGLSRAPFLSIMEMMGVKGAKALSLSACFEIAKRIARSEYLESGGPLAPERIYEAFRGRFEGENQEAMLVLMMDKKGRVSKEEKLYRGSKDGFFFSNPELIQRLLMNYAESYLLIHNHPSGNPLPSKEDVEKTLLLEKQTRELGIKMEDHLLIGDGDYYSFRECRLIY